MWADYPKIKIYGFTDRLNHPVVLNLLASSESPQSEMVGGFRFCKGASSIRADSCSPETDDSGSNIKKECAYRPVAGFINSLKNA
jgi:hypothetical protein